ncbi:MAG: hypothetical protein ACOX6U_08655 [Oscillospiraceae bacterium]|jgi:hypothetical protein
MKIKHFIAPVIILSLAVVVTVSVLTQKPKEVIVPLPKLVKYYEGKLDPEIPRITVTVEHDGESYVLPYDAAFTAGELLPEEGINRTWFVNLMNNFWSLPKLGGENYTLQGVSPALFTITFDKMPDGEVTILDYSVFSAYGYAGTYYEEGKQTRSEKNLKEHTRVFAPQNNEIFFLPWTPESRRASSNPPPLLGLRIVCSYNGQPVEYYILYQNIMDFGFLDDTDFSHLTPLEP